MNYLLSPSLNSWSADECISSSLQSRDLNMHIFCMFQLYESLIGPDGWCINYEKSTRKCSIYAGDVYLVFKILSSVVQRFAAHYRVCVLKFAKIDSYFFVEPVNCHCKILFEAI